MVHRDIKPSNLLLSAKESVVKVLDLGLARMHQGDTGGQAASLTRAGAVVGTPDYIAPEQVDDSRRVDIRADMYSLGCTFYYLLSGHAPFPNGTLTEKLLQHKLDEPVSLQQLRPDTPPELVAIVRKLMDKDPNKRFQTPKDVCAALEPHCQKVTPAANWGPVHTSETEPILCPTPVVSSAPMALPSSVVPSLPPAVPNHSAPVSDDNWTPLVLVASREKSFEDVTNRSQSKTWKRCLILLVVGTLVVMAIAVFLGITPWAFDRRPDSDETTRLAEAAILSPAANVSLPVPSPVVQSTASEKMPNAPPLVPVPTPPTISPTPITPPEKVGLVGRFEGHTAGVRSVAFSPDDAWALSCGLDYTMRLWNVESRREVPVNFDGNIEDLVWSVAFSFDGRYAVSGSGGKLQGNQVRLGGDNVLLLWDLRTGRVVRTFKGHTDSVQSVAFSHGGRYAVSGSFDRTVRIWDVDTGKTVTICKGHTDPVRSVAFARDGDRVVSGGYDKTVRLWDVKTGKQLGCFVGHLNMVTAVAFTPDGRQVLSASLDRTVRVWDVKTATELGRFVGHSESVWCVAASPNGEQAVSGGADNAVRMWDLNGFQEIRAFTGHTKAVMSVAFANDGRHILSGSDDHSIRLWALPQGTR
jgi:WD40 repeat protein